MSGTIRPKRTRKLVEGSDHLELAISYVSINDGTDITIDRVRWQWRGRCSKNGSAKSVQQAQSDAVMALDDWSRA